MRWDVKSPTLNPHNPGEYKEWELLGLAEQFTADSDGYNIILDLSYLDAADASALFELLKQQPGFDSRRFAITRGRF